MLALFPKNKNLDFVCCWYKKANDLIQGTATRCAFVSTNSITQGEQVAPLWKNLNAEIDFAYRTFKWHNEAKGVAAVHCVIIGFHAKEEKQTDLLTPNGVRDSERVSGVSREQIRLSKTIYDSDGTEIHCSHINGYLMDAPDVIVESRNTALCDVPQMVYGNKPTDGGNLILTPDEKDAFLAAEPQAEPFFRPLLGAEEFINGKTRYCLWLVDADLALLRKCPNVLERIEGVRRMRLASKKAATRKKAEVHPDFMKGADGRRNPANGINPTVEIAVLYGCVSTGGIPLRVKTTVKRLLDSSEPQKAYTYEISNVEVLKGNAAPVARPNDKTPTCDVNILLHDVLNVNGEFLLTPTASPVS